MPNEIKNKGAQPGDDPKQSSTSQTVISSVQVEESVTEEQGEKDRGGVVIHNHINVSEFFQLAEKFFSGGIKQSPGIDTTNQVAFHSRVLESFMQGNVSKKEGFTVGVQVAPSYEADLGNLIRERAKSLFENQ